MGGSSSKSMVSILNDISMTASMRTIQSCSASATQDQLLELEAQGNIVIRDVTLTQGVQVNSKCMAQTQKQLELKNDIASAITNFAESSGPAVIGALGANKSDAIATVKNILNTNINMDTIQENVVAALQRQKIKAKSTEGKIVVSNLTMEQTAKVWAEALVADEQFASSITKLAAKMEQATKAETTDPIANLVGSISKGLGIAMALPLIIGILSIVGIIVLVLIIVLISRIGKKSSSESSESSSGWDSNVNGESGPLPPSYEAVEANPDYYEVPEGKVGGLFGGWA
jgi:hypothetical protein